MLNNGSNGTDRVKAVVEIRFRRLWLVRIAAAVVPYLGLLHRGTAMRFGNWAARSVRLEFRVDRGPWVPMQKTLQNLLTAHGLRQRQG